MVAVGLAVAVGGVVRVGGIGVCVGSTTMGTVAVTVGFVVGTCVSSGDCVGTVDGFVVGAMVRGTEVAVSTVGVCVGIAVGMTTRLVGVALAPSLPLRTAASTKHTHSKITPTPMSAICQGLSGKLDLLAGFGGGAGLRGGGNGVWGADCRNGCGGGVDC